MCARRVLRAGLGVDTLKGPARRKRPERELFVDPMPDRVEPCLALLAKKAPEGDDWAFEVKWDGYRLAIHIVGKRVRIITRGGHDWTPRFPTIAHDALELGLDSAILDGEAVVLALAPERGVSIDLGPQMSNGGLAADALHAADAVFLPVERTVPIPQREAG